MAGKSNSNFANNGALIFALFSAVALAFNHYAPLQVARPEGDEAQFHQSASGQDTDARLWQDPFAAVAKAEADRKNPLNCEGQDDLHCRTPIDQLSESNDLDGVKTLVVLAATVSGAPYAEAEEDRRRARYAVVSGLNRMGFSPDDAQHIGFFHKDPKSVQPNERRSLIIPIADATGSELASSVLPITIPFELFVEKTPSDQKAKVLVLWLDEDKLRNSPLAKMSEIFGLYTCPEGIRCPREIIGPRSSDTLQLIVEEADKYEPSNWPNLDGVPLYAYGATVPDSIVFTRSKYGNVHDYLKDRAHIDLWRTIATDDVLANSIVGELKLRGIEPGFDQHVVLISEWDTLYGRTSAETFEHAFIEAAKDKGKDPGKWIVERTYLHGLDGALPQSRKNVTTADEAPLKPGKDQGDVDARALDKPYGQGQDDYLRRLADDLKAQDAESREKIKAIGVIGGDVFDKLRVLRALKREFSDALFFTTDFDASLAMQSELGFTRNLLIASGLGPQLRPERQCHIPPFRDVYETSAFLATQLAMTAAGRAAPCPAPNGSAPAAVPTAPQDTSPSVAPAAMIFEIARTGDVLALPSGNPPREWSEECSRDPAKCTGGVQPDDMPLYSSSNHWLLIPAIGFFLFGAIAGPVIGSLYKNAVDAEQIGLLGWFYRLFWPIVLSLLGIALFAAWYCWPSSADWITERAKGEPMRLMLGVSVWPAIMLRVATLLLSVWLICVSFVKSRTNLHEISKRMDLEDPTEIGKEKANADHRLKDIRGLKGILDGIKEGILDGLVAFISNIYNLPARKKDAYDVASAWRNYVNQSRVLPTVVRTLCWVALTFTLFSILWEQFGPPLNPARGPWMHSLYQVLTQVDVFLMWFLVFLIVDVTLFCYLFVRQLSRGHSNWNGTKALFAQKLGLDPSTLPFDQKVLNDWIDLSFIGQRTSCVNSLIWYPFGVIALMIISRSSIFANFPASAPILITQGFSLVIIIGCAFLLNGVAEDARALAAQGLSDEIDKAKGQVNASGTLLLEHMLERVQTMQEGSFQPFLKQPVIGAILLPISSIGWTTLLEEAQLFGLQL